MSSSTGKACAIVPAELGESIGDYGAATVAALGIENELDTLPLRSVVHEYIEKA